MDGRSSSPHLTLNHTLEVRYRGDFQDGGVGAPRAECSAQLSAAVADAAGAAETAGPLLLPPMKRVARLRVAGRSGRPSQPLLLAATHSRSEQGLQRPLELSLFSEDQSVTFLTPCFWAALSHCCPNISSWCLSKLPSKEICSCSTQRPSSVRRKDVWSMRPIKMSLGNEQMFFASNDARVG